MATRERWAFRITPETDQVVREAAASTSRTLTDFVVDAAVAEAERVLADRRRFSMGGEDWDRFVELLDRPPREQPGLHALFSRPSVFDDS